MNDNRHTRGSSRIPRRAAAADVNRFIQDHGVVSPLIAVCTRADSAIYPNIGDLGTSLLKFLRIADRFKVLDPAAHCDGKALVLCVSRKPGPVNGSGKHEKPSPIRHLNELRHNRAGRSKGRVDIKARTGPAVFGQVKTS